MEDETKILSLYELEEGPEYEIVITNQAGLYRYRCGDVIRVCGYFGECPYVQFSRRKGQLLNLTGEKTTEEHMSAAVRAISKAAGCEIHDWVVYNRLDVHPYRYVLRIENSEGLDLSCYADLADRALREINPRYGYFVDLNKIGRIEVGNLRFGTSKEWMKERIRRGAPGTQVKPVRILDTPEKEEFFLPETVSSAEER